MKKWLGCFLLSASAMAADPWKEGLHLNLGGGPNTSLYRTRGSSLGGGLHFKTNFDYAFREKWALGAGSVVKFTKLHDTLIWDTLLSVGVRRRLPDNYFVRVFVGQAPTVFFTDESPAFTRRTRASRIIYTGPALGITVGRFLEKWFWEISASYQSLDNARGVRDEGSVPEEVFRTDDSGVKITSLTLTFGVVVF